MNLHTLPVPQPDQPPASLPLSALAGSSLDDTRFALRCLTHAAKRRRYRLSSLAGRSAVQQVVERYYRFSG